MKRFAIGCLAVVGAFVIVCVVIAAISNNFNPQEETNTTTNRTTTVTESTTITKLTTITQATSLKTETSIPSSPPKPEIPTASQTTTTTTTSIDIRTISAELLLAQNSHLIDTKAFGTGSLKSIKLSVTSKSNNPLLIFVVPGTIFNSQSIETQSMLVLDEQSIVVKPLQTTESVISTASIDLGMKIPSESDSLALSPSPARGDLEKLIGLPDFQNKTFRIKQFAIWTISNNPEPDAYTGTGYPGFTTGPSDTETQEIKELFKLAGIQTEIYLLFGETLYVELVDSVQKGLVDVSVYGSGSIDRIRLSLTSKSDDILEVLILPGTIFDSNTPSIQSMVVTLGKTLQLLYPHETIAPIDIEAACANMELKAPGKEDALALSLAKPPEDLNKLLYLADFRSETYRVRQFAIWTITDNPKRDDYMGIATGFQIFGTGPTDEEMAKIRALFEKAGIPIGKYQAFG